MKRIVLIVVAVSVVLTGCKARRSPEIEDVPVEPALSQDIIQLSSTAKQTPATLTLTVPEGYTLARIGMKLEEMGICTAGEFIMEAQSGNFSSFPLVAAQQPNENRCFSLEGYLYPDTYHIYATDSANAIIGRMLTNMEDKITPATRALIDESGYTVDEVLTLASIIEKESFGQQYMPGVSSVLHNRLDAEMRLQCDVTITYVEGAIKPFITGDLNRYNEYYNTYKCAALPAGPICNPSMAAIEAALSPPDTPYFYFITDNGKNYYYAEDWNAHVANIQVVEAYNAQHAASEEN